MTNVKGSNPDPGSALAGLPRRTPGATLAPLTPHIPTAPYAPVTMTAKQVRTARAAADPEPATVGYGQLQADAAFGA